MFTASVDQDIAHHSGGVYLVRIEDTDQSRFDPEAASQFEAAFDYFGIGPDEGGETGGYGPYAQSERGQIYLTYVRELMRQGKAYPCFETKEQARGARREAAARPARCPATTASGRSGGTPPEDQVRARLAAGDPYVVRFRSPGVGGRRVSFTDVIRGEISSDDNRNDVVILKSSDQPLRLPTYHFAHAVDDHLMRVTLVIRGEEWLSSVPLHHQLFDALGFPRIPYAHVAPLMKQDGGSRRKLSKRRDPEASVGYYIEQGFPAEAVQYYLRGLANGRLAELPLPEALAEPLRLSEFGVAGPLLDMVKLDDVSADFVSTLPGAEILDRVLPWADGYDPDLARSLRAERDLALRALAVEREGTDNPRKDLRKWADFRPVYGFFFPEIFEPVTDPADDAVRRPRPGPGPRDGVRVSPTVTRAARSRTPAWFEQIRELCRQARLRAEQEGLQEEPGRLPRLDRRRLAGDPGAAHRLPAQPRPGPGLRRPRRARGAAPRPRPQLAGTSATLNVVDVTSTTKECGQCATDHLRERVRPRRAVSLAIMGFGVIVYPWGVSTRRRFAGQRSAWLRQSPGQGTIEVAMTTLTDLLPRPAGDAPPDPDSIFSAFAGWATGQGLALYPHQEEALIEVVMGSNVILSTPTGSGKSLVAAGAHFAALANGQRSYYTAPIKALVSEKFFALCDVFGAANVGMMTGDASRQRQGADHLLHRRGAGLDRAAGRRRRRRRPGRDGRVPLLRRPRPRLGLAGPAHRAAQGAVHPDVRHARRCHPVPGGPDQAHRLAHRGRQERRAPGPADLLLQPPAAARDARRTAHHQPGARLRRPFHPGGRARAGAGADVDERVHAARRRTRSRS